MATASNLVYLFDRPVQPIFRRKGQNLDVNFELPQSYYTERYKSIASQVVNRNAFDTIIPVKEYPIPDITKAMSLNKRSIFSVFNDSHRECAANLINVLMGMKTIDEFQSACCYIQQRVNPYLYIYALSVAMIHRPDTQTVSIPSHVCTFPELYVDGVTLSKCREEAFNVPLESNIREAIQLPRNYTASDLEMEQRVAYFREDIAVNLHHSHWHLVYPGEADDINIVKKDRRGELFYYMHHQLLARYNFERLCNGLARIIPFSNLREPIKEAYFPKLDTLVASRVWAPRHANVVLSDLKRELQNVNDSAHVAIADLERWRDRIFEAIHRGTVRRADDSILRLTETEGIDILGNMIEASPLLSPNINYYGNLHNLGHNLIAFCHDPDYRYLESAGVMGTLETAMRDPMFYRWHDFINDIFLEHKNGLTPYTTAQLGFDNVRIAGIQVNSQGSSSPNILQTFWQRSQVDLTRGLDERGGSVLVSFEHLQHSSFTYSITIDNSGVQRQGTVRIFIAPRFDERGTPFLLRDQKKLFVEMDKFVVRLRPGQNTITRDSIQSSVTIPFEQSFRSLENRPANPSEAQFCGCGWPDHMLVPKGNSQGVVTDLFVMVTDFQIDKVEGAVSETSSCDDAASFCGLRNSRYPDRRAMGFPFDRMPRSGVQNLKQFLTPNMALQEIRILHNDQVMRQVDTAGRTITGGSTTQSQG